MLNPYKNKDDHCFWSRAVTTPPPGQIDPVTRAISIGRNDKIATMGSCFAQHLSKHIQKKGFNYFVAEAAPTEMSLSDVKRKNYGVFSARYGNIYTVRQALQLMRRAFESFEPADAIWRRGEHFVDAFRPQIDPDGFTTIADLTASRSEHLAAVRRVITECHWLVFTLGLTEGWRSKIDGAVYPIAPGVSGGSFDETVHEFVNFSVSEISEDLRSFVEFITRVNPNIKILLTVSPVPLIATYESRHVLVSNCFSKAALRVAADEAERRFSNVIYFPSYEIITSPSSGSQYYHDDLREVTEAGINHVMRMFSKHFVYRNAEPDDASFKIDLAHRDDEIVCDEETIERALQSSGFASRAV